MDDKNAGRGTPAYQARVEAARSSRMLLAAIFATGKLYGPMTESQMIDAVMTLRDEEGY